MTPPCKLCGSERAAKLGDCCRSVETCNRRRIARRIAESKKQGGRQCPCTVGHTSIRFCLLREGHSGMHATQSVEWGGNASHPLAAALLRRGGET